MAAVMNRVRTTFLPVPLLSGRLSRDTRELISGFTLPRRCDTLRTFKMKTWLSHGTWALVAATTFVIGTKIDWSEKSDSDNSSDPTRTRPTRSSRSTAKAQDQHESDGKRRTERRASVRGSRYSAETSSEELAAAFKSGNLIERRLAFAAILEKLTPENARDLRELIADFPQDSPEFREFHYAWGAVAGVEAVTHGRDTPKKDMAASLAGWASSDPSAALAYFDTLSPAEQNSASHMKWGAAYGLADADPTMAVDFAVNRAEGGDRDAPRMIHIAAAAVLRTNNPSEAAEWASGIPEGPLQNAAIRELAGNYAREEPTEAVAWATNLPEGEGRGHAVGTSFHNWANRNAQEAANAINNLPAQDRDAATYGYATSVVHRDPALGVEWAANIQDQESRNRALVDTGRVFYRRNRDAANDWIANAGLSDEVVRQITNSQ